MALSFTSSNRLILLYRGMEKPPKAKKYDIMLSPQFYIIKKEQLPIKYNFQAKKVAPSILDEFIGDISEYEIITQKEGNLWSFIAYKPKEVETFLKQFGIMPDQIGNLYFSDQIVKELKKIPINLDEKALSAIDGYATIIPKTMLTTNQIRPFSQNLRPKKAFTFKSSTKLKNSSYAISKGAVAFSIILSLIGAAFFAEALTYQKALKLKQDRLDEILAQNQSLSSDLTREAIKKKYESKEKRQRAIREAIKTFSALSSKKSILQKLELQKDKIVATFKVDSKEIKHFKSIAITNRLKIRQNGNIIVVEEKL